jgi:2-keto-4-pentenoate hydratase
MTAPSDDRVRRGLGAQMAAREVRLAGSDRHLGWKVGFGTPAALEKFGLSKPLVGHMFVSNQLPSGGTAKVRAWTKPAAEPEVGVRIGSRIRPTMTDEEVLGAVKTIFPAIELADVFFPPEDVAAILESNIFHRHVITGPEAPLGGLPPLADLTGQLSRNGGAPGAVAGFEKNTGDIVSILRFLAEDLETVGLSLDAGDIVITGSVTPPVFLGDTDSQIAFEIDGIGSVSVNLDWSIAAR